MRSLFLKNLRTSVGSLDKFVLTASKGLKVEVERCLFKSWIGTVFLKVEVEWSVFLKVEVEWSL